MKPGFTPNEDVARFRPSRILQEDSRRSQEQGARPRSSGESSASPLRSMPEALRRALPDIGSQPPSSSRLQPSRSSVKKLAQSDYLDWRAKSGPSTKDTITSQNNYSSNSTKSSYPLDTKSAASASSRQSQEQEVLDSWENQSSDSEARHSPRRSDVVGQSEDTRFWRATGSSTSDRLGNSEAGEIRAKESGQNEVTRDSEPIRSASTEDSVDEVSKKLATKLDVKDQKAQGIEKQPSTPNPSEGTK